jgi:hypothetical protein
LDAIEVFDGEYGGDYDFITNNCAIKVIDVMYFLGFDVHNRTLLTWIRNELQTQPMIDMFSSALNVVALYSNLTRDQILAKPNAELFDTLIDYSIKKALDNYAADVVYYQAQKPPSVAPGVRTPTAAPANGKAATGSVQKVSALAILLAAFGTFLAFTF